MATASARSASVLARTSQQIYKRELIVIPVVLVASCGLLFGKTITENDNYHYGAIENDGWLSRRFVRPFSLRLSVATNTVFCQDDNHTSPNNYFSTSLHVPSFLQRTLYKLNLASLPLPRLMQPNDGDLTLSARCIRQRQQDDQRIRQLQQELLTAIHEKNQALAASLLTRIYTILYGINNNVDSTTSSQMSFSPQDRQDFLQRYGCTGWTEHILMVLLELGQDRGLVEMGAGQGQWARALTDRHFKLQDSSLSSIKQKQTKHFEFVLAYDNKSALPLNPEIYHNKTLPYQQHFYDKVQDCSNDTTFQSIFRSWECRGRVLLLVYPGPDDMAVNALKAYTEADARFNDTLVFVGEGRGGANANDAFFDRLESGDWVLETILPVRVFGTKGYERMFVFKRRVEVAK
jgi:hypothetical protein